MGDSPDWGRGVPVLAEVIVGSKKYVADFDEAECQSASAQKLVDRMVALHGTGERARWISSPNS